jgi:hypothetical protein
MGGVSKVLGFCAALGAVKIAYDGMQRTPVEESEIAVLKAARSCGAKDVPLRAPANTNNETQFEVYLDTEIPIHEFRVCVHEKATKILQDSKRGGCYFNIDAQGHQSWLQIDASFYNCSNDPQHVIY